MAKASVLNRKEQLDLLVAACEQGTTISLSARDGDQEISGRTRMVAMIHDGMLLAWDEGTLRAFEWPGTPVEAQFDLADESYAFVAETRGRAPREIGPERLDALRLSMPLRLERWDRRVNRRVLLSGFDAIPGRLRLGGPEPRTLPMWITDLSLGGLGARALWEDAARIGAGEIACVEFELPGEPPRVEFIVQLMHRRPLRDADGAALGFAFAQVESTPEFEAMLVRVETVIAERIRAGAERKSSGRGESS